MTFSNVDEPVVYTVHVGVSCITIVSQVANGSPWVFKHNSGYWSTMNLGVRFFLTFQPRGTVLDPIAYLSTATTVFKMLYENRDSQEQVSSCNSFISAKILLF